MAIDPNGTLSLRRAHVSAESVDEYELEARLAQLERRYAEASMRFRRARDEYHSVGLQPSHLEAEIAAARERYEFARRNCENRRRDIDEIESRLG